MARMERKKERAREEEHEESFPRGKKNQEREGESSEEGRGEAQNFFPLPPRLTVELQSLSPSPLDLSPFFRVVSNFSEV